MASIGPMMKVLSLGLLAALALLAFPPRGMPGSARPSPAVRPVPSRVETRPVPDEAAGNGVARVVLRRADNGHFYAMRRSMARRSAFWWIAAPPWWR